MKRSYFLSAFFVFSLLISLLFVGCGEDEPGNSSIEDAISVEPQSLKVSFEEGEDIVAVTANREWNVTIKEEASWLTSTKTDDSLTLIYEENTDVKRSTFVILTSGSESAEVMVEQQDGVFSAIETLDLPVTEGTVTIEVTTPEEAEASWTVSSTQPSWLTATKIDNTMLTLEYEENPEVGQRNADVTLTLDKGNDRTLSVAVTQEDINALAISVNPSTLAAPYLASVSEIAVTASGSWNLRSDASWLTIQATDNKTTLTLSYTENIESVERVGSMILTLDADNTIAASITVTQAAAGTLSLLVSPASLDAPAETGMQTIDVTATGSWRVNSDESWLTANKVNDKLLTLAYANNTGGERNARATLTLDDDNSITADVAVTQVGGMHSIVVNPTTLDVPAIASTNTVTVTATGDWTVSSDQSWLTTTKTNATTLTLASTENTGAERTATATLRLTTGNNVTANLIVTQVAADAPSLLVNPAELDVPAISNTPSSVTVTATDDWTVSSDESWLTATKTSATTLTLASTENTGAERTATATMKLTTNNSITADVTVTQAVGTFSVAEETVNVSSDEGMETITVTAPEPGDWTVSDDGDWLTATKENSRTLTLAYTENTASTSRSATATLALASPSTRTKTVTVTQRKLASLSVDMPTFDDVPAIASTNTVTVTATGDWTVSSDQSWLTTTKTNATTLTLASTENTGAERTATATLRLTTENSVTADVTVTQAVGTFSVAEEMVNVSPADGMQTIPVTAPESGNWTVSDDGDWLTATKTNATTLTLAYTENTAATPRTATATLALASPSIRTKTVTVTQREAASLSVDESNLTVNFREGDKTVTVTGSGSWNISSTQPSWLTATMTNSTTLTLAYTEYTETTDNRTATVELALDDDPAITATVRVNQRTFANSVEGLRWRSLTNTGDDGTVQGQAIVFNKIFYLFNRNSGNGRVTAYKYDTESEQWSDGILRDNNNNALEFGTNPEPLIYDGNLYLFTATSANDGFVLIYKSSNGTDWEKITTDIPKVGGFKCVLFDDKLWLMGGFFRGSGNTLKLTSSVWNTAASGTLTSWNEVTKTGIGGSRWRFSLFVFKGKMYVVGQGQTSFFSVGDGSLGFGSVTGYFSSEDGVTWTEINASSSSSAFDAGLRSNGETINNVFAWKGLVWFVNQSRNIFTSEDGTNFTKRTRSGSLKADEQIFVMAIGEEDTLYFYAASLLSTDPDDVDYQEKEFHKGEIDLK